MKKNLPFDSHVAEYEEWYKEYPFVFQSEVEALRQMLPEGENLSGIEVGLGTGKFAEALGIKEGIEPSANMRALAVNRGLEVLDGIAERLPYKDLRFDFVVMAFCISYFDDLQGAFREAHRVLKKDGTLVVGFIDQDSTIGKYYEEHRPESTFYREANFYSVEKVVSALKQGGFKHFEFCQTLFKPLNDIKAFEHSKPGTGEGSFVVVQARKKK
ncbi:MAG: class I SAM-dependent methyltransferase [Cyclobacteriaceae bacterium]|nr:class I SAM-dependent methyltransferase [Cyclobacteriaceae bacterium]MDH4297696.1 class I SAM-dependent methyltransferase [Cyclobacteriaceae bacterium]MDH5250378.1 class I SAM-dependent methyltransferase [Cyclobacteriaceae bacterium]